MKESDIQKSVIQYLQILENQGKLYFIRNNSFAGKITRPNGSTGYIKNNKKGVADIIVFPKWGRGMFLEIKRPGGVQSPDQKVFEKTITKLGYSYYVITDLEDIKRFV